MGWLKLFNIPGEQRKQLASGRINLSNARPNIRASVVINISGKRELKNIEDTYKRLSRYDGKTFFLRKHQGSTLPQSGNNRRNTSVMKSPSLFIPKEEFLSEQAAVLRENFRGLTAFTDRIAGGGYVPARGTRAYRAYQISQQQRVEAYMKYLNAINPPNNVITKRNEYFAVFNNRAQVFSEKGQYGRTLNTLLTNP